MAVPPGSVENIWEDRTIVMEDVDIVDRKRSQR